LRESLPKIKDLEDMRRGSPSETRARLYKQLGDLQDKMTRVEDLYFDEAISRERFDSKKSEIVRDRYSGSHH
jgi:hypothetical protein